jgi:tetratricopeptide (TPR) repeat protein
MGPLAADPGFRHRRESRIKLGVAHEKLAHHEQAVDILRPVLDLGNDAPWDPRTGNGLRAEAQWSIALSFLHLGDYESALQAIEDAEERHPAPRNCGDERWVDEFRNEVYRGLALEHLGRYPEAVQAYMRASAGIHQDPTPVLRLADLYESTGQWEKLRTFVGATDDSRLASIRRVVELRELEHRDDLQVLFAHLFEQAHIVGALWDPEVRRRHWERLEVAELLARHPPRVARLKDNAAFGWDRGVLYYTLGLTGTKEAAAALRDQVLIDPVQGYRTEVLTYALGLAGEPGREVLDELAKAYPAVATYRAKKYPRHWFLDEGLEFPPLPKECVLPALDPSLAPEARLEVTEHPNGRSLPDSLVPISGRP